MGVASGLGEAFINRNNTIKVSKGNKVSKINRGSGVLVVNADCEGGAVFWKEGSR